MSLSLKMVDPKVNIQRGIMKNAEKVDTAVMVTDRSKFPPNITVQMLEAPPPGEQPEKQNYVFEKTAILIFLQFGAIKHFFYFLECLKFKLILVKSEV